MGAGTCVAVSVFGVLILAAAITSIIANTWIDVADTVLIPVVLNPGENETLAVVGNAGLW